MNLATLFCCPLPKKVEVIVFWILQVRRRQSSGCSAGWEFGENTANTGVDCLQSIFLSKFSKGVRGSARV